MSEEEERVREVSRLRFGKAAPFEEAVASLSSDKPIIKVDVSRKSSSRLDVGGECQSKDSANVEYRLHGQTVKARRSCHMVECMPMAITCRQGTWYRRMKHLPRRFRRRGSKMIDFKKDDELKSHCREREVSYKLRFYYVFDTEEHRGLYETLTVRSEVAGEKDRS